MNGWCREDPEANEKGPNRKEDEYQSTKGIDENEERLRKRRNLQDSGKKFNSHPWQSYEDVPTMAKTT